MSNCTESYAMGVYNSEKNEIEDIAYPCEREEGHAKKSPHVFTKDGREYPWFDPEQIKALQQQRSQTP